MNSTARKLSELERALMEMVYQSRLTEMKINQLSDEMSNFKDEMRAEMKDFKNEMKLSKKDTDKKWGDLARKMGTLIEDIFVPPFDLVIEKYFGLAAIDIMTRRKIRKNGDNMELDILAFAGEKAFVVEVKSSPNRREYVLEFIDKLQMLSSFIPEIQNYQLVAIYAALDIDEKTVQLLTSHNIFALVVRGDILTIVNYKDIVKPDESTAPRKN